MLISMEDICDWAGTNPAQRNFIEGERVLQAGHIINCGRSWENEEIVSVTALCLQVSKLKEKPHRIEGNILRTGKILSCICTCKAGQGEKCKHIIATLLYCYQKIDALEVLSYTDKPCSWKKEYQCALSTYEPASFMEHLCLKRRKLTGDNISKETVSASKGTYNDTNNNIVGNVILLNNSKLNSSTLKSTRCQLKQITNTIIARLPNSAYTKHCLGRHIPVTCEENNVISESEKKAIQVIFELQNSILMESIKNYEVCNDSLKQCCQEFLKELDGNFQLICEQSKQSFAVWHKERQYRITGSRCYNVYTYTKNKSPDWKKKSSQIFSSKNFKSEFTEYGKIQEKFAREAYVSKTSTKVIEIGLVICKQCSWLAYSPDGIVFQENKPLELIEIKCPFIGKTHGIKETINSLKYLDRTGENISLKEKHQYYAQAQLGMAILNLTCTNFIIYSSFDKNYLCIKVYRNEKFVYTMLQALKKVYYNFILHEVCLQRSASKDKKTY